MGKPALCNLDPRQPLFHFSCLFIIGGLAVASNIPPLILMLPATMAASCAFMLPVATPPNAIVYGSGLVRLPEMARVGLWINIGTAFIITGWMLTWGAWVF